MKHGRSNMPSGRARSARSRTTRTSTIDQRTRRMEELGSEPLEPLKPELTFGDPTIEGLIKNWPRSQASLGIFTTEGAQIFGGYGMNDDNRSKTGGALSELWDGTPVKRNRASDLTSVYGRRLAMHIMVQPVIVRGFLSSHELRGQGLISRILIAAPNSRRGSRLFERPTQAQNDAIDAFAETNSQHSLTSASVGGGQAQRTASAGHQYRPRCRGDLEGVLRPHGTALRQGRDLPRPRRFCRQGGRAGLPHRRHLHRPERSIGLDHRRATPCAGPSRSWSGISPRRSDLQDWAQGGQIAKDARNWRAAEQDEVLRNAEILLAWLQKRAPQSATEGVLIRDIMNLGPNRVRLKAHLMAAVRVLHDHNRVIATFDRQGNFTGRLKLRIPL